MPEEQAVTKAVDSLVTGILAREERHVSLAKAGPVSKREQQAALLQSKVRVSQAVDIGLILCV